MNSKNLNLFFNKTYYDSISSPDFNSILEGNNNAIYSSVFRAEDTVKNEVAAHSFKMMTEYPGLLVGTGYSHGAGIEGTDNDINCGFSFEYVSGQPYIPASSVKGLLRSCFKYEEVIASFCKKAEGIVKELENSIFGDTDEKECGTDVFFDAVLDESSAGKQILGSDYITPHSSPVNDPTPILILKIMPEVVFKFRFSLKDSVIGDITVTAEEKRELFIKLLGTFGIGAKTNVGYGSLRSVKEKAAAKQTAAPAAEEATPSNEFTGVVVTTGSAVKVKVGSVTYMVKAGKKRPRPNDKVKIRITDPDGFIQGEIIG